VNPGSNALQDGVPAALTKLSANTYCSLRHRRSRAGYGRCDETLSHTNVSAVHRPDRLARGHRIRQEAISGVAKKNPDPDDAEKYIVLHSAITYVLGPDGKFFTHFTDATEASDMAHALVRLP
jgi:cytochrome oxidase Cu insertion factor (SCO1/SenC/PrrC family)